MINATDSAVSGQRFGVSAGAGGSTIYFDDVTARRNIGVQIIDYTYDANGNMTSGAGRTISWDAENRPITITLNGITTTFAYDGDGKRVKKVESDGSAVTTTIYVGNYLEKTVIDRPGQATTVEEAKYYYANGKRIAMNNSGTLSYIFSDHLGGTSVTLNASTGVTSTVGYFPFGGQRFSTGSIQTDYLFTGQRSDAGSGLYDYGARRYDASLGRFISPDTIVPKLNNPQTLSRYTYALNNPMKYNDPDGHFVNFVVQAAVGAVVGAGIAYGVQVVGNVRDNGLSVQAFTSVDGGKVLAGAVAGGVGAVTFGASLAVAGAATGVSVATASAAGLGVSALSGVASGRAAQVAENAILGKPLDGGLLDPAAIAIDAVSGGAGPAIRAARGQIAPFVNGRIERHMNQAIGELVEDPAFLAADAATQGRAIHSGTARRMRAEQISGLDVEYEFREWVPASDLGPGLTIASRRRRRCMT